MTMEQGFIDIFVIKKHQNLLVKVVIAINVPPVNALDRHIMSGGAST
jgi:hypothetical protein